MSRKPVINVTNYPISPDVRAQVRLEREHRIMLWKMRHPNGTEDQYLREREECYDLFVKSLYPSDVEHKTHNHANISPKTTPGRK